ncbi:MAG: hypothetical protein RQ826_12975, partial [Xanthomonadales bacterium]|nr:hypothetical protein [Xanthomonadales bacterium]
GASVNDVEMHARFWAEDLVYTSSAGERRGKSEIMASLRAAAGYDPFPQPKTIAQHLLAKRREMGWSIREAAAAIGVDPSWVRQFRIM